MLIKENTFLDILTFSIHKNEVIGVINKSVYNLSTDQCIRKFDNPVGTILTNGNLMILMDWYRNSFIIENRESIKINNPAVLLWKDTYIESLPDKKGSSLKVISGNSLWTTDLIVPSDAVSNSTNIFFLNSKDRRNKSLVSLDLSNGEIAWEIFIDEIINNNTSSSKFGKVIGVFNSSLFVYIRNTPQIIKVDTESKSIKFFKEEHLQEMLDCEADIEALQIDSSRGKLVHPYFEYDILKEEFTRISMINQEEYIPNVFPFCFNSELLFYGCQSRFDNDKGQSICKLKCSMRNSGEVVFSELVNLEIPEAGIKRIVLDGSGYLYVLDSFGVLVKYKINHQFA